jgi:UDP-2-acetamido-3-amino-2,3-dideoxy-glucuronate N-acetyltransferase
MTKDFFKHQNAKVETADIGHGTRINALSHIYPGSILGEGCEIGEGVVVESNVIIGNNVILKNEVKIGEGTKIENDVFVGANTIFVSDILQKNRHYKNSSHPTIVKNNCSIGAGSTILPNLVIGEYAIVGAGSVVTNSVSDFSVVLGSPAKAVDQSCREKVELSGCIFKHRHFKDTRGDLFVGEFFKDIPFAPKRFFIINGVPQKDTVRGEHAHIECEQYLICVAGEIEVVLDDGKSIHTFKLNSLNEGLYIPPKVWGVQTFKTVDTVLFVFASEYFLEADYIRKYENFKKLFI